MVDRPSLSCSLERFTASFGASAFLKYIAANAGALARVVECLETKHFFLLSRCCIAIFVDRPDIALLVTEYRLNLSEPMSTWTVPTPPVQILDEQQPVAQSISSGESIFNDEVWQQILADVSNS